jgi:hypothetical protein
MAISFLETKGAITKIGFKPDRVFWTLLATVLLLLLVFGGLKIYGSFLQKQVSNTEEEIKALDAKRDLALEKEIQSNIATFEKIEPVLSSHIRAKNIFELLEKDTYADAQLSNFSFNAKEGTLSLSVTSPSAVALAMQVSIFKSDPKVKKVEIGGLSFSEEGINFQLKITLDPSVLKY